MTGKKRRPIGRAALTAAIGISTLIGVGGMIPVGCGVDEPRMVGEFSAPSGLPQGIVDGLTRGEPQLVIVGIDDSRVDDLVRDAQKKAGTEASYEDFRDRKAALLADRKEAVREAMPDGAFGVLQDYKNLPMIVFEVDTLDALYSLISLPEVTGVWEEETFGLFLTQSLPLIDQPEAESDGKDGTGATVAVLDTGTDYTHSAFGSCSSVGGSCKVIYAHDFAPNDGSKDDNGHGTNVAGAVLGVAPGAKIAALDVFQGAGASSTDIIEAIDWCVDNKATYSIVAMNMSLGGGAYSSKCSGSVFSTPIETARTAGILTVAATGNDGYTNKVAAPACAPQAVSVGAVYDSNIGGVAWSGCTDSSTAADKVTCFSNSASFITMLAPGAMITAAGLTQGGTSQASPHVAGAVAVLRAAFGSESMSETVTRLTSSGVSVTDHRNSISKPRLDLDDAAGGCLLSVSPTDISINSNGGDKTLTVADSCDGGWTAVSNDSWITVNSGASGTGPGSVSLSVDTNSGDEREGTLTVAGDTVTITQTGDGDGPTGTVSINSGDELVGTTSVTLTLSATDASEVTHMCMSNSTSCSNWKAYTTSKEWTLTASTGNQKVYVWFKDEWGNVSESPATDLIFLDLTVPVDGEVELTPDDTEVELSWSGYSDKHSGVASYKVVYGNSSSPANCNKGNVAYEGTDTTYTHESLTNGTLYYYRVCAIDEAGTMSYGTTAETIPAPEFDAPDTTSVVINDDDEATNNAQVTLTIDADDDSTISKMCISNTNSCINWINYNTTKKWNLDAGTGTRTVYIWFRDEWSNTTTSPVTDTILLDSTLPVDGALSLTPDDTEVAASWTGFSDKHSGLASYKLVFSGKSTPATCSSGGVAYEGTDTSYTHESLTNGKKYYYRVCAVDEAGNVSTGKTADAIPAPEYDAPASPSVSINSDDDNTNNINVSLTLSATDANTISHMCISNTNSCTSWVGYNTTKNWTLSAGNGNRTVYVWFRDEFQNETTSAATDAIYLDTTLPKDGSVSATEDDGEIALTWTGFSDKHSGLASYKVVFAGGTTAPATCNKGTEIYAGTDTTYTHESLTNGNNYAYRVCAVDEAGNLSAGKTLTTSPTPETDAPTSTSVSINSDDTYSDSVNVTLTLAATDANDVTEMCLSNSATCSTWIAYNTTKSWTLASGSGTRTVSAWFRDEFGNETSTAATDDISLDTTEPVDGTFTATEGDEEIDLAWASFSDAHSGIASYKVVQGGATAPATCDHGTSVYTGTASSYTDSSLTNGQAYSYRICAIDNAGNMSDGTTASGIPRAETNAPTSTSVSINSDDDYTNNTRVSLTLSATDANDVTEMCISNGSTCTSWVAYATTKNWDLTAGNGSRTVSVWFRDEFQNETSTPATDDIDLDTTLPTNGTLTATPGDEEIDLSWTGFADAHSGIDEYKLVVHTSVPANCNKGTEIYAGSSTSYTHESLTNGTTYYYLVCAVDNAANTSTGASAQGIPAPETTAPASGSVVINSDDDYTKSTSVTLTISATDSNTITKMCVSNTTTCSSWVNYATSKKWNLDAGNGNRTVYVWFRDEFQNETTTPVDDTIYLDTTVPKYGSAEVTPGDTEVDLSWSGFSDKHSGLASYKVVYSTKSTPATCNKGNEAYAGTDTSYTHESLTNGTAYYYLVCGIDEAGNLSTGVAVTATPAPEFDAPADVEVSINSDDDYTNSTAVTLTLTATDDSTISKMCISNSTSCSNWTNYNTTKNWTLDPGNGTRTVRVWLRDEFGNATSSAATDTIYLDTTLPVDQGISLAPDDGEIVVSWTAATDKHSGVASYKLVYGGGSTPANCSKGNVAYEGTDTTYTHESLTNGSRYYYLVCAIDEAGNTSGGVSDSGVPAPEFDAPTDGEVVINSDDDWTSSTVVTLTLSADDDSTISKVCISNSNTCSNWTNYNTTKEWTIDLGNGTRTVRVWFRDEWGNATETAVTDSISLDTTLPKQGSVTVTPGDTELDFSWTGFSDKHSGMASYKLVYHKKKIPANCNKGLVGYEGTDTDVTVEDLVNDKTYYYRLCGIDEAGNYSTGLTGSAAPAE